ncbi:MAG: tRNA pseudouridine(55) synthase TruB [Anaerolineales bacterium]
MTAFGVIVVDKPVGPTSHFVVDAVRRGTGVSKVGHAGTLDPRASGVLVLCLGPATRLSEYLSRSTKGYEAQVQFGKSTETYDAEGAAIKDTGESPALEEILRVLPGFRGDIQQTPPPYSAVKVAGKKAYELAREGKPVELEPRTVTIFKLEPLEYQPPEFTVWVECSAGTYIRSLAHDLGETLGCGAHLSKLRRVKAGPYTLNEAVGLSELQQAMADGSWPTYLRPAADALPDLPIVNLEPKELELVRNGLAIPTRTASHGLARALAPNGELAAILEASDGSQQWHPRKVFLA